MSDNKDIWSVSRLNQAAQRVLEKGLPQLWLEGELSNFSSYASGHWYFKLKDNRSQIQAVMFRGDNKRVNFTPKDGQQLRVLGEVSLYTVRGSFQIKVKQMLPAGRGDLLLALEQLKQKLAQQGLFEDTGKKPLPRFPRRLGVITSASGAAFHDILRVLKRRHPQLPIILYPASVQGDRAASELNTALQLAIERNECDVLIIGRGGGSLEDLLAFSDETLTRAVAHCPIPIISAVGHEVDFSLTDFAADLRAATPSHAAELVAPDANELQQQQQQWQSRLERAITQQLKYHTDTLHQLRQRLSSPVRIVQQQAQRLDDLQLRLQRATKRQQNDSIAQLQQLQQRLVSPARLMQQHQQRLGELQLRLQRATKRQQNDSITQLQQLRQRLISPARLMQQHQQRLGELQLRLQRATKRQQNDSITQLQQLQQRLVSPARLVQQHTQQLTLLYNRLQQSYQHCFARQQEHYQQLHHRLQMAGPNNLLSRGYSITLTAADNKVVRAGEPLKPGTRLTTRLANHQTIHSDVVDGNA